ncbi:MAG TPA: sigma-70 family RNA polymerase sigma factor [Propionibacteriaceae bacterium]|nr:sigma-70 family RNA polymerase sigma factor [Propionibacteriaceae bacterium]
MTTELLSKARCVDDETGQELRSRVVVLHLDVAESVAWRYRGRGQDHQDLVQVARLGLIEAVERFDPDRGPFLAYAVPTMVGHVKRHFRDHGWMVRPPRQIQEKQAEIARAKDELTHQLRRRPTVADIANYLGFTKQEVQEAQDIEGCFHPASLDAALAHSANDLNGTLGEKEPQMESIEALATVSPACRHLPDSERRLLYLRFYRMCSQEEIAAEFGISQMQVSRWLRRTLAQLKADIGDMEATEASDHPAPAPRVSAAAPVVKMTASKRPSRSADRAPQVAGAGPSMRSGAVMVSHTDAEDRRAS